MSRARNGRGEEVKPLWLLDVDGVLNPAHRPGPAWERHQIANRVGQFDLWLNATQGPALVAAADRVGAELVWATMWEDEASTLLAPLLGLPDMPFIDMTDAWGYADAPMVHGKTPCVAQWVAEHAPDRPFVWFDDELTKHDRLWLKDMPGVGAFRLIQVGWRHGLSDKHIAQAEQWTQDLRAAA